MRVLVTGGAGYIGSHCVYELIKDGHEVVVFDNLSVGSKSAVHKKAILVVGDIHDAAQLDQVMTSYTFDAIIHFAASIVVSESVKEPLKYYHNNLIGVHSVLSAMTRNNVKNIVFSSTAAVYGTPKEMPCVETTPTHPESPYGESKLASENMIKWVAAANDLNYTIFRYFNVCGADESGNIGLASKHITHIIPSAIEAVLGIRDKLTVFGTDFDTVDGTCIRDYIHVSDLARAHVLGLEYMLKTGVSEVFNLGSNAGYSVKQIVESVSQLCGDVPFVYGPRRDGDPAIIVANADKAKELLKWEPKYKLDEMIRTDYQWRSKHPKGY